MPFRAWITLYSAYTRSQPVLKLEMLKVEKKSKSLINSLLASWQEKLNNIILKTEFLEIVSNYEIVAITGADIATVIPTANVKPASNSPTGWLKRHGRCFY